jgi:putative N6-adenine-specific DNA methylase
MSAPFEIFLACAPGFEQICADEAIAAGFPDPKPTQGGVTFQGTWQDTWRANLSLRLPTRILARFASFRAFHLAQLDKRAKKTDWSVLPEGASIRVETTCKRSKIYHAGAATQRISNAIEAANGTGEGEPLRVMARIDDNLVTISVDTSGEPLHKRGAKQFSGKAPLRETLAAGFLMQMGYDGSEPVLDPMCGSGTFLLEAASMATASQPGAYRSFAFERLTNFDPAAYAEMKPPARSTQQQFHGFDRDQGAVQGATRNAERAGLADYINFTCQPITGLKRPEGPPGIVMINPPYGTRISNKKPLYALHTSLGDVLRDQFSGWRVGIVTTEPGLARATKLPLKQPGPPIPHGGLKIRLYQTAPLP